MRSRLLTLAVLLGTGGPGCSHQRPLPPSTSGAPSQDLGSVESASELLKMELYLQESAAPRSAIRQRFQLDSGERVHCIDFFEQRSLRGRPRGKIALSPRSLPAPIQQVQRSIPEKTAPIVCPIGTIPVRDVTIESLKKFRTLTAYLGNPPAQGAVAAPVSTPLGPEPTAALQHRGARAEYQYAIADFAPKKQMLLGGQAFFSVWQPRIDRWDEHSLAELAVVFRSEQMDLFETIEVGWRVFPARYHDPAPHLFVFTSKRAPSRGNRFETWCYDADCPNFVWTSRKYLGRLPQASLVDGEPVEVQLGVYRDLDADRWWIYADGEPMGYFERDYYGWLHWASEIQFYGEIWNARGDRHTATQMGSGLRPLGDDLAALYRRAAYFRDVRVSTMLDGEQRVVTGTRATDPRCYGVKVLTLDPPWNTTVFYGGPGYTPGLCE